MGRQIIVVNDSEALSRMGAEIMAREARTAIAERGRFSVALAGGSTVKTAYELFAAADGVDWGRVVVLWGDDRFVDADNPYSNYALAKAALLDRVPIPPQNVVRVNVKAATPAVGAREYAAAIRTALGVGGNEIPVIDLVQLGMGPDGHTASLFPHSEALDEGDPLDFVRANHAGLAPWVDRVTFTFSAINSARSVLLLAGGANKAGRLREVFEGPNGGVPELPVVGVAPVNGHVTWVIDKAASAELSASTLAASR